MFPHSVKLNNSVFSVLLVFVFQDWKPGSRCRAVYTEDGLVYPAVVLWVKGQRCRIRFDHYNNEEDQNVSGLLKPDELHGPGTADTEVKTWTRIQYFMDRPVR